MPQRRGSRSLFAAVLALTIVLGGGDAGASTTFSGRLYAYPRVPGGSADISVVDRQVTLKVRRHSTYRDSNGCTKCKATGSYHYFYPRTNSSGSYSYTTSNSDVGCSVAAHIGEPTFSCEYDPEIQRTICGEFEAVCSSDSMSVYAQAWASYQGETDDPLVTKSGARDTTLTMPSITQVPHEVYSKHWARRLGSGRHPVFLIEGFDPLDQNDSNYALAFLRGAYLNGNASPGEDDLHSYLTAHDFTIWLIMSGDYGDRSIAGLSGGTITDTNGLAYDAMKLIKKVRDRFHAGEEIVVGGYSMGGLIAKAGLYHWCRGDWDGLSTTYDLNADCPEVALWFAADSPLQGATLPMSLQYYLQDSAVTKKLDAQQRAMATALLSSAPAQEMLKARAVLDSGADHCDTDCGDTGGCTSSDSDFTESCHMVTYQTPGSPHRLFTDWAGGLYAQVRTAGGAIKPGIAFSVGRKWSASGNLCYQDCRSRWNPIVADMYCGTNPDDETLEYMKIGVTTWGDHHLISNSADGYAECDHGSKLSSLLALAMSSSDIWHELNFTTGYAQSITVRLTPSFITSRSAMGGNQYYNFTAHSFENADHNHAPLNVYGVGVTSTCTFEEGEDPTTCHHPKDHAFTVPPKSVGFLTAWIWEFLRGKKTMPLCSSVRQPYGNTGEFSTPVQCRQASCGDGLCESEGGEHCSTCANDCGACAL